MFNTPGGIQQSSASGDINRLHVSLHSHFQSKGLDQKKAASWSLFCIELYSFAQKNPRIQSTVKRIWDDATDVHDLLDGGQKIYRSTRYIVRSSTPLGISSGGYVRYGLEGLSGITGVVVDRFAPYARKHDIQLDESGIALAVLCFGLAATGAGPIVLSFGLVVDILMTGLAGYRFGKAAMETKAMLEK